MKTTYRGIITIEEFYKTLPPTLLDEIKYWLWKMFLVKKINIWRRKKDGNTDKRFKYPEREYRGEIGHPFRFKNILGRMKFYKVINITTDDGKFISYRF